VTATFTITATATVTPTFTATSTITLTRTHTPTVTASATCTPTLTPSASVTNTVTLTPRFSGDLFDDVRLETKVVTPAGARFNHLRVYFKSREDLGAIRVRIFNLHGALAQELQVQNTGNQYLAEWDCRDTRGRVEQGIYIYQLEIGGHAYKGAFVIAK
jgi:hypothetical protein